MVQIYLFNTLRYVFNSSFLLWIFNVGSGFWNVLTPEVQKRTDPRIHIPYSDFSA